MDVTFSIYAKSNTSKVDSMILTLTLLRYQNHFKVHSKSCFKKSASTTSRIVCHFTFPQSTTLVIMVNANFKIISQRQISNEYINGYFLVVATTFICNHDIHCFIGGNGLDITNYIWSTQPKTKMSLWI